MRGGNLIAAQFDGRPWVGFIGPGVCVDHVSGCESRSQVGLDNKLTFSTGAQIIQEFLGNASTFWTDLDDPDRKACGGLKPRMAKVGRRPDEHNVQTSDGSAHRLDESKVPKNLTRMVVACSGVDDRDRGSVSQPAYVFNSPRPDDDGVEPVGKVSAYVLG
jgi:hypothetical protein